MGKCEGVEFEYDDTQLLLHAGGREHPEENLSGAVMKYEVGDVLHSQERRMVVTFRRGLAKFVFVTYPHWR
jgi:ethanolamine utilization protein EutQ (cupin superfamily)